MAVVVALWSLMDYAIGIGLALVVSAGATLVGFDRGRVGTS